MLILEILGLLPFSGVMFRVLFSRSMSVHERANTSPALAPVSLAIWRKVAMCVLQLATRSSIYLSSGMKGSFLEALYIGLLHLRPNHLQNRS